MKRGLPHGDLIFIYTIFKEVYILPSGPDDTAHSQNLARAFLGHLHEVWKYMQLQAIKWTSSPAE